jgi:hypothetical protein
LQDKAGGFAQSGPACSGDLQDWQQDEHANREVHDEWVEAPEELEPVRMRASIEPQKKWCERQDNSSSNDRKPLVRPSPGAQGADRKRESLRSNQANNPCTT